MSKFNVGNTCRIKSKTGGINFAFSQGQEVKIVGPYDKKNGCYNCQIIDPNSMLTQLVPETNLEKINMKYLDFKIRGTMNGIKYPCLVDVKYDGIPVLASTEPNNPTILFFENNKEINSIYWISSPTEHPALYLAEWVANDGKNGDLHDLISIKSKGDPCSKSHIEVYDCLEFDGKDVFHMPLIDRRLLVESEKRQSIKSIVAENKKEVMDFAEQMIKEGYEGVVVKNLHEPFNQQTWVKIKKEEELILPVRTVGIARFEVEYKGKFIGVAYNKSVIAGIIGQGPCDVVIKHNGITKNGSLRHPVAVRKV